MRTPTRLPVAAVAVAALILPALPVGAAVDAAAEQDRLLGLRAAVALHHLDPADAALLRRARHAVRVLDALRDGQRPPAPSDRPASDARRDLTDRPADRPTDRRPDRPTDAAAPHREETFPVGEIGAVTLAWNQHGIRIVHIRTADGWRSRVTKHERRAVAVGFSNGESGALFWARLTPEGLRHGVERRPVDDERDVHTFEVLDAGTVAIAVTDHGLRLVGIRENEGWISRHEVERRRIHVVFGNREERRRVDFVAEMNEDGEIVTHIREVEVDERPPAPDRTRDGETDAARDSATRS